LEQLNVSARTILNSTAPNMSSKNANYLNQLRRSSKSNIVVPTPPPSRSRSAVASTWSDTTGGVCTQCEQEIAGRSLTLSTGYIYHADCLSCQHCNQSLTDNEFMMVDNQVFHNQVSQMVAVENIVKQGKTEEYVMT
jgi:hypothetical protein